MDAVMENLRHEAKDLALAPNEYAFIMDTTKGQVNVYTGPNKASLSQTDQPVVFSDRTKKFEVATLAEAKKLCLVAPENWYIVLKNPASDDGKPHPIKASNSGMPDLELGHKINIPGPISFALWPGQMSRLIQGHRLHQNQYLLIRVYDEQAARDNWDDAVVAQVEDAEAGTTRDELVMGKLMVVKGTDFSFYMPPTGIEVVRDEDDEYVRDAVTLERLEYCLLLDQSGGKRYVRGPAVVFPEPTENFVERNCVRKFRAIELNQNSGLYVKVIAPYTDSKGDKHEIGEELFVTGKERAIYFPREEHAIVKYGKQEKHYGIAIPKGEARYVLNRKEGDIRLEKGPSVFLPDPREEVIIRRILDLKTCGLLYPGNTEALSHNQALLAEVNANAGAHAAMLLGDVSQGTSAFGGCFDAAAGDLLGADVTATATLSNMGAEIATRGLSVQSDMGISSEALTKGAVAYSADSIGALEGATRRVASSGGRKRKRGRGFTGDAMERGTKYTPPRTVTLNTKYEGAVTINVYEGYAIMLVDKAGKRRVIEGPQTALFEYDETPHFLRLSTGKPKTTDRLKETVYLKIRNNPITDIIQAETKDFCKVNIKLTYRVNFEGNSEKWFSVENYVKLLTHNMRSMIRNFVKKNSVEEFYQNSAALLRDLILGKSVEGVRSGRTFEENGMHIHDVEVLETTLDHDIEGLLIGEQRDVIKQTLAVNRSRRDLLFAKENEDLQRQIQEERSKTAALTQELKRVEVGDQAETAMAELQVRVDHDHKSEEATVDLQTVANKSADARRARLAADHELELEVKRKGVELDAEKGRADAENTAKKAKAITPDLIAALQSIADTETTVKVAEALGTTQMLKVIGGESISDVLARILEGSKLGERLPKLARSDNGRATAPPAE